MRRRPGATAGATWCRGGGPRTGRDASGDTPWEPLENLTNCEPGSHRRLQTRDRQHPTTRLLVPRPAPRLPLAAGPPPGPPPPPAPVRIPCGRRASVEPRCCAPRGVRVVGRQPLPLYWRPDDRDGWQRGAVARRHVPHSRRWPAAYTRQTCAARRTRCSTPPRPPQATAPEVARARGAQATVTVPGPPPPPRLQQLECGAGPGRHCHAVTVRWGPLPPLPMSFGFNLASWPACQ
jgi:hypothetical protein